MRRKNGAGWAVERLEARVVLSAIEEAPQLPSNLYDANGLLLYVHVDDAHGREVWRSDGTQAGTYILKDIFPGPQTSRGDVYEEQREDPLFTTVGNTTYFAADDGVHGQELWKTDGTTAGTVMVRDLRPGADGSYVSNLMQVNGSLYFFANADDWGLWKLNPTTGHIGLVSSEMAGTPIRTAVANGRMLFTLYKGGIAEEIWESDGTPRGTTQIYWEVDVKDLTVGIVGNTLLAGEGESGDLVALDPNVWTQPVLHDFPDGTSITFVDSLGGRALFTASRWEPYPDSSLTVELWSTDGTVAGTKRVRSKANWNNSNLGLEKRFTKVGNNLYFTDSSAEGFSLWKTDGTAVGTSRVTDSAQLGYSALQLTGVGGTLYFEAGAKLWKSGGTAATTMAVANLPTQGEYQASVDDAVTRDMTGVAGRRVFFVGLDPLRGAELYTYLPGAGATVQRLRSLLPSVGVNKGILTVDGWSGDDDIRVVADGKTGRVTVYWNDSPSSTYAAPAGLVINGGDGDDTITVTGNFAKVTLNGGEGSDTMYGGDGNDLLFDEEGSDSLFGGAGNDTLRGGNHLEGGAGNDFLYAQNMGTDLYGGPGNDYLQGENSSDYLYGGDGADTLFGGLGNDYLQGDAGADVIRGWKGYDTVEYSTRTADLVISLDGVGGDGEAGEGDNVLADVEKVECGSGNDRVTATAAANTVHGGGGADTIIGGAGNDSLDGGNGDDQLIGGAGNDSLYGGYGVDALYGNNGNDWLDAWGDSRRDWCDGGGGMDSTYFKPRGKRRSIENVL